MKFGKKLVSYTKHFLSPDVNLIPYSTGPFLLGCRIETDLRNSNDTDGQSEKSLRRTTRWEELPPHDDEGQVKLDVDRSFIYYPTSMH